MCVCFFFVPIFASRGSRGEINRRVTNRLVERLSDLHGVHLFFVQQVGGVSGFCKEAAKVLMSCGCDGNVCFSRERILGLFGGWLTFTGVKFYVRPAWGLSDLHRGKPLVHQLGGCRCCVGIAFFVGLGSCHIFTGWRKK